MPARASLVLAHALSLVSAGDAGGADVAFPAGAPSAGRDTIGVAVTRGPDALTGDPDADLVRAAAGGDVDAFETLVRRYQARVVSLIRATVAPAGDAEDLAQDVFVRVYRSLGSFRGDSAFRTWLYKVTLNVARSHRTRLQRLRFAWGDSGATDEDVFDTPDEVDLEAHVITRDAVERALEALPEDLRVAVTLRDVHGLEYRDIAEATGTPMGTVESRIFRARQRLRVLLAGVRPRTRGRGRRGRD